MERRNRIIFTAIATVLLLITICHPVLADEVYDTVYEVAYYEVPFGNGVDDDGDGVIDNIGEPDVVLGSIDMNTTNSLIYQWNSTFETEYGIWDVVENGIAIAPVYDQVWEITSSGNASVNAYENACYRYEMDAEFQYEDGDGGLNGYTVVPEKMLPVVKFKITFKPTDIMNGASMVFYRSPLAYDITKYDDHILNIYNADDNNLVFSNINQTIRGYDGLGYPISVIHDPLYPQIRKDNSTIDEMEDYYRVYYRIDAPLYPDVEYRFEEYVSLVEDEPVNSVILYMAQGQDLCDDGEQNTYIFSDTPQARKIPCECSYSFLFKVGIGLAGIEIPLPCNGYTYIISNVITGTIDNVKSVRVIIPLRTTATLQEIDIELKVMSGGLENDVEPDDILLVGGTIVCDFNLNATEGEDPDTGEINYYQLHIDIDSIGGGATATTEDRVMMTLYPSQDGGVLIKNPGNLSGASNFYPNFNLFFEVIESGDELAEAAAVVEDTSGWWFGAALAFFGITLMIIAPPLGFVIITSGAASGLTLGIAAAIFVGAAETVGAYYASQGFSIMGGGSMVSFLDWAKAGIARVASGITAGINLILGGIAKIVVAIVQAILWLGDAILHFGGIIFEAAAEIIWLLAFLIVIWVYAKFLDMMKWITLNKPGNALSTIASTTQTLAKYPTAAIGYGLKTYKTYAKGRDLNTGQTRSGLSESELQERRKIQAKRWYDDKQT
jgi:hypothetical protein